MRSIIRSTIGATLLIALLPQVASADVYGNGSYSQAQYSSSAVATGILPATGPVALGLASIVAISIGVGLTVWARQRRRKSRLARG